MSVIAETLHHSRRNILAALPRYISAASNLIGDDQQAALNEELRAIAYNLTISIGPHQFLNTTVSITRDTNAARNSGGTTTSSRISPSLVTRLNDLSAKDLVLANILHKAAANKATVAELNKLKAYIDQAKKEEVTNNAKGVSDARATIVLEFAELVNERLRIPKHFTFMTTATKDETGLQGIVSFFIFPQGKGKVKSGQDDETASPVPITLIFEQTSPELVEILSKQVLSKNSADLDWWERMIAAVEPRQTISMPTPRVPTPPPPVVIPAAIGSAMSRSNSNSNPRSTSATPSAASRARVVKYKEETDFDTDGEPKKNPGRVAGGKARWAKFKLTKEQAALDKKL